MDPDIGEIADNMLRAKSKETTRQASMTAFRWRSRTRWGLTDTPQEIMERLTSINGADDGTLTVRVREASRLKYWQLRSGRECNVSPVSFTGRVDYTSQISHRWTWTCGGSVDSSAMMNFASSFVSPRWA